jgi:hypothetical protein
MLRPAKSSKRPPSRAGQGSASESAAKAGGAAAPAGRAGLDQRMGRDAYNTHAQVVSAATARHVRRYAAAARDTRASLLAASAAEAGLGCSSREGGMAAATGSRLDGEGAAGDGWGGATRGHSAGTAAESRGDAALLTVQQLVALLVQADVQPPEE